MTNSHSILQIVPRAPGGRDGVGDYARILSLRLRETYGFETTFVAAAPSPTTETSEGFPIHSPLRDVASGLRPDLHSAIILHYVNYGFDRRGIPLWLPRVLCELRAGSKLLTIFHELYASGSLRQSAFWLGPLQRRIARSIAELSDEAIVSSEVARDRLRGLAPKTRIMVHPVFSNLGEPSLSRTEIARRDPHRWVICGGGELVARSLRSFLGVAARIEGAHAPRELLVIGGAESLVTRRTLNEWKSFKTNYYPEVDAREASALLAGCAFGWIDYFTSPDIPFAAILKSGAFAACCAHGVLPVSPSFHEAVALKNDCLPGPFFVSSSGQNLPPEPERGEAAWSTYSWYQRNASSSHLAAMVASALGQIASPADPQALDLFIVHWNQPTACVATVTALQAQEIPLQITVVDNDSEVESFQQLEKALDPTVAVVRLDDNKGWGGALNVVLRHWLRSGKNSYCLISAHDAMPAPDCLRLLVSAANADPQVGIACPQYPEPYITRFSRWRGVHPEVVKARPRGVAQQIDVPHGTLMLVRRECLEEIGLFDQRYFAYGDEHELGARAVRHGWKVVLVWGAMVINPATSTESVWRSYLFARNSLFLVRDYFGRTAAAVRALLILVNTTRLLFSRRDNGLIFSAGARWKGVRDYFSGRTGRPIAP
ncbi:MAG: glycosyltransferase family 2 protein [Chthoniobacterales bacterium]